MLPSERTFSTESWSGKEMPSVREPNRPRAGARSREQPARLPPRRVAVLPVLVPSVLLSVVEVNELIRTLVLGTHRRAVSIEVILHAFILTNSPSYLLFY